MTEQPVDCGHPITRTELAGNGCPWCVRGTEPCSCCADGHHPKDTAMQEAMVRALDEMAARRMNT